MLPAGLDLQLRECLSARSCVRAAILFGSRARGDAAERSDIDLAIVAPTATPRQWLDLVFAVQDLPTLLSFDLIRWETAPPELQARIIAEGVRLYDRNPA